jgi:hypothetical protein
VSPGLKSLAVIIILVKVDTTGAAAEWDEDNNSLYKPKANL